MKLGFTKSSLQFFWKKLWMVVGLENTCTISGKWNVSKVVTRLYEWVHKIRKTTPINNGSTAVSHQGDSHLAGSQSVVITEGSQPGAQVQILWVVNFRLHTCLHSLSPPYFRKQLRSYWAPSHIETERWLFASPFKHVVHILLYIFWYFIRIINMLLRHRPTKKSFALRFKKLSLAFNSHLVIVFVLVTCNTSVSNLRVNYFAVLAQTFENFRQ